MTTALPYRVVFELSPRDPTSPQVTRDAGPESPPEGATCTTRPHLAEWFLPRLDGVTAVYRFDDTYLQAHPEAVEPGHLGMLHALLTFKLFDEGWLVAPAAMLPGSLRWPGVETPRKPLVAG